MQMHLARIICRASPRFVSPASQDGGGGGGGGGGVQLGLEEALGVPRAAILSFVLSARARMLDNPYHNWAHVVDVTQAGTPAPARSPRGCHSLVLAPSSAGPMPISWVRFRVGAAFKPRRFTPTVGRAPPLL